MRQTVAVPLLVGAALTLLTTVSACSGCQDRGEWTYTESDTGDAVARDALPDTTPPDIDARPDTRDGSTADAPDAPPRADVPEPIGPPCWSMGGPDPQGTGQSACRGPSSTAQPETIFSREFDVPDGGSIWWNMLRVGPKGVMYYAFGRDAPATRVLRYDPQSGTTSEFDVAPGDRELHDMAVTSNGMTITLEGGPHPDGSTAFDVRWYTPDGELAATKRLPPRGELAIPPYFLTDGERIWVVIETKGMRKIGVYELSYDYEEQLKAQWNSDFPVTYAFDGDISAEVSQHPVGPDSSLQVKIRRSAGERTYRLANLGLEPERPLDDPDATYTRPILTDDQLVVLVNDAPRAPFEWVCQLPLSRPSSGECIQVQQRVDARYRLDTLLVDAQLVGLYRRTVDFGSAPLSSPTDRQPWMNVANQDVVHIAADRRGQIYLLSQGDRSTDGSHELSAWSPDGQKEWSQRLDLPEPVSSMIVGDRSLYVSHFSVAGGQVIRKVIRIGN